MHLTAETYCSVWPVTAGQRIQGLPTSVWLLHCNEQAATPHECLRSPMEEMDALPAMFDGEEVEAK